MSLGSGEPFNPSGGLRRIGMEALAVGTGQVAAAIGSVVGVRVLTEAMSPAAYGELALAMTMGSLGLQVLLAPLTTAALRQFAPAYEAGDLRGYLLAVQKLFLGATMVIGVLACIGVAVLALLSRAAWIGLTLAAFAFTLFAGGSAVLGGMQNATRRRVVAATHSAVASWLRFAVAVVLIHLTAHATSGMAMAGYALASAGVFASQLYFVIKGIAPMAGPEAIDEQRWVSAMLTYGWPFAAWGIFVWAQLVSDRWALGAFATTTDVGYYSVVYQLGFYPILMASSLLGQVLEPILYARAGDASDPARVHGAVRLNARVAAVTLGATVLGALAAAQFHPLVGRLLLAPEYRGVTHYLPWVVVAGGLFATGQVASTFFMISKRSAALAAPKIVTAIAGVAMTFVGAKWWGIAGVIGASIAFGVVYCAWVSASSWLALRRLLEAKR